jgi:predicted nucleotidyltransferase
MSPLFQAAIEATEEAIYNSLHGGNDDRLSGKNGAGIAARCNRKQAMICYNALIMAELKINVPRKELEEFCKKHHIRKLAFFGSVLREDFKPESDVDVLVEFEEGKTPGLAFFGMEQELAEIFERDVDLLTFKGYDILESARAILE